MFHSLLTELRTIHYMLFYPAAKSFDTLAHTAEDGTWQNSYSHHRSAQRKVRLFSASSLIVIISATFVSNYILSFIF